MSKFGMPSQCGAGIGNPCSTTLCRKRGYFRSRARYRAFTLPKSSGSFVSATLVTIARFAEPSMWNHAASTGVIL